MTTGYKIHPPHKNYLATLTIRGTKADFIAIGLMLQKGLEVPAMSKEELEDQRKVHEVLEDIDEIINYINGINDNGRI